MRKYTDFMIWNHIFMIYEVCRGLYYQEYIYFILGSMTSILSVICHLHHERKY